MVAGETVFGRLSKLECWQQDPGEERRLSDMFTLMPYLVQGISVVVDRENPDYGRRINEELSIVFELDLDTRLLDVQEDERGAKLVKDQVPVMPPVIEDGLNALAKAWDIEIGWQMVAPTKATLTLSHFLTSFIGGAEETREWPTLFLGLADGEEIDKKLDEWRDDADAFLDHFGRGLIGYINQVHLMATLSAGEDRRHGLAARIGFDVTDIIDW